MIEFLYPDAVENSELERVLLAAEEISAGRGFTPTIKESIADFASRHGEEAAALLIGSYLVSAIGSLAPDEPPTNENDAVRYSGRIAYQCGECGGTRCGLEWKPQPIPDGWQVLETLCPECEATS